MERKKASDYPQELLNLFDLYVHGDIDRRKFLDGAKKFATGGVTAVALWESLHHNYAFAETVPKNDARLKISHEIIDAPKGNGKVEGYLVRPANATGKIPGVLVVHENRGRNPYIEDVARRLGLAGFMAFAPDELYSMGGYPGDEEKGVAMFAKVDREKMNEDFYTSAMWLKNRADSTGKLGVVGFCFGGGICNYLAVRMGSDLAASVPYYGAQPKAEDAGKIKAAMLLQYGALDDRITGGWPAWEAALKANHVNYQGFVYEGANHGFHNDTTPRFDEKAATLSWQRTIEHFNKYLKG